MVLTVHTPQKWSARKRLQLNSVGVARQLVLHPVSAKETAFSPTLKEILAVLSPSESLSSIYTGFSFYALTLECVLEIRCEPIVLTDGQARVTPACGFQSLTDLDAGGFLDY